MSGPDTGMLAQIGNRCRGPSSVPFRISPLGAMCWHFLAGRAGFGKWKSTFHSFIAWFFLHRSLQFKPIICRKKRQTHLWRAWPRRGATQSSQASCWQSTTLVWVDRLGVPFIARRKLFFSFARCSIRWWFLSNHPAAAPIRAASAVSAWLRFVPG